MKALKEESLLKQVSKKLKSLSEPELEKIDEWIDKRQKEKYDAMMDKFMNEFGAAIGLDRPFLQLVKKRKTSSSNKKSKP
ncbi:hypothetical protein FH589_05205 [Leptospira interrogans]|uniref:hypothetical protein n=1 Tax=Leptospira interrogans TaxID=173 RepID=UPI0002B8B685|nr:hypothetical protein [Leptospira interrogans]EMF71284.1 hypothetical protein LEP1GSC148_3615 [Leptospira interrogans serovar Canicola str. LT1962]KAA1268118.1 hypothetical protein C5473_08985 [Leptospira interrogans serovar Weerasinghe]EMM91339.1 hypothetical protein LEP1GSC145_1897 [Leptospira interrogans serovar Djasiman str. LT1649]MCL8311955.1 hypothetical protein [Leptospira interrogans]ULG81944.1 hypothetical protein FH595_08275 [Leptospira interrogans]